MEYPFKIHRTNEREDMNEKKTRVLYRVIRRLVKAFSPRFVTEGEEHLPEGACVIAGNHSQMYGPIAAELYTPGPHYTWCAQEMMHLKEVPAYAYQDFWSYKPAWARPFYRLLSYVIAPLSSVIFNDANTIGVYRDMRVLSTFRETVQRLEQGCRVVIFPEKREKHNNIVYEFQTHFVDTALLYHKKTGKRLAFVPMYLCPARKTMYFGAPVYFDPENKLDDERARICRLLMDAVTDLAVRLPLHTVVPYENLPKKAYPKNKPLNEEVER